VKRLFRNERYEIGFENRNRSGSRGVRLINFDGNPWGTLLLPRAMGAHLAEASMAGVNYHMHNEFCDGEGSIEDYVRAGMERGFAALGFSSHAPIPVENDWTLNEERLGLYLTELERQRKKWNGRIEIYKGLEIDYIPGSQSPEDFRWSRLGLDFAIASVHCTCPLERNPNYACVDSSENAIKWLLDNIYQGSFELLSEAYFARIAELVRLDGFDILAHFDVIKKRNSDGKYFSENALWYRRHVALALEALAASDKIMELNTGAICRNAMDVVYPSPWILADAAKRDIRIIINSDAHRPRDIDCYFEESIALCKDVGYNEQWALLNGAWTALSI